jgi:hypothetical protein
MSTDIELESEGIAMVQFWGGNEKGSCIQLTSAYGYVQMGLKEAAEIAHELSKYVKEESIRRQNLLKQQSTTLKSTEKSVFNEIAEMNLYEYEVSKLITSHVGTFCPIYYEKEDC